MTLGWERHVSGRIESVRLDGKHSTLHIERAREIGSALGDALINRVRLAGGRLSDG
jgi:hypothetical protein